MTPTTEYCPLEVGCNTATVYMTEQSGREGVGQIEGNQPREPIEDKQRQKVWGHPGGAAEGDICMDVVGFLYISSLRICLLYMNCDQQQSFGTYFEAAWWREEDEQWWNEWHWKVVALR